MNFILNLYLNIFSWTFYKRSILSQVNFILYLLIKCKGDPGLSKVAKGLQWLWSATIQGTWDVLDENQLVERNRGEFRVQNTFGILDLNQHEQIFCNINSQWSFLIQRHILLEKITIKFNNLLHSTKQSYLFDLYFIFLIGLFKWETKTNLKCLSYKVSIGPRLIYFEIRNIIRRNYSKRT